MDTGLYNQQAEETLLGAALVINKLALEVNVEPAYFVYQKHSWIWEALIITSHLGDSNVVAVSNELDHMGKLGEVGGDKFLGDLVAGATTQSPLQILAHEWAKTIRDLYNRRRMHRLGEEIVKRSHDMQVGTNETSDLIDRLLDLSQVIEGAVGLDTLLLEMDADLTERIKDPQSVWGIKTKFPKFDQITGGLQKGESLIIGGNPGIGKSMIAVQMGFQMAEDAPGAIYSLEMSKKNVVWRIVSARTRIESRKIKGGNLGPDDQTKIVQAYESLSNLPVLISGRSDWTTTSLMADLTRLKAQHGIEWFIVDYLALLSDSNYKEEHQRIAAISRHLKLVCRQLDLAGIFVHSLTKQGMASSIPGLAALRGEAGVSFDADVVVFLTGFNPVSDQEKSIIKENQENMRTLIFKKGRELQDPRRYIHFVKATHFPEFQEYIPAEEIPDEVYRG